MLTPVGWLRSVDDSEAAFLAEDFTGSRWSYQCKAVAAIAESLALFSGAQLAGSAGVQASPQQLCIIACGARPRLVHPPCSLADTRSALAALQRQQHAADGGQQDLGAALRLASVRSSPWLCRPSVGLMLMLYQGQSYWRTLVSCACTDGFSTAPCS